MSKSIPVFPGAKCRIINGAHGPQSPSVGRICWAVWMHPVRHEEHGNIWHVHSADGKDFVNIHGGVAQEVDVAESWLEVIPPEEVTPKVQEEALAE